MLDDLHPIPPHALMQDAAFTQALRLCGEDPITLPDGTTLLNRRFFGVRVAMLPRAIPPVDLRAQIASTGLRRALLILSPEGDHRPHHAIRLRRGIPLARIDLTQPEATRRRALHSKWRNQLKRAENAGITVLNTPLPANPNHPLLQADALMARTRRYATWPTPLTCAFAKIAPKQTRLFSAVQNGKAIAQMLFLRHGTAATYHIGNTSEAGRRVHAHNLLLWQASCWLALRGATQLDLGPLAPQTPSLNRFKLRAGATKHLTGGTWLSFIP